MLPVLLRFGVRDLGGIGWRPGLVLTTLGDALFALLQTGGYGFTPLAHGAVIAPSTVTIVSTVGAALFLRERLGRNHLIGAAIERLACWARSRVSSSRSALD
jgi:drug/metabolite transporter (DMT)-like permease